jgi:hypothetical protein
MREVERAGITRREFCALGAAAAGMPGADPRARRVDGSWPTRRQNVCLTASQPLHGRVRHAPVSYSSVDFGRYPAASTVVPDNSGRRVSLTHGALRCHDAGGKLVWTSHPRGINYTTIVCVEDLDGDGEAEVALMAGRPTDPLGAALLVSARTGEVLFRYDVEPMSYWWTLKSGQFLPNTGSKQLVMCEHGYPPDAKFGYIVLFEFPAPGRPPVQRWRFDFDHYTCYPTIMTADVNRDGADEICVECHSRMWVFDARSGALDQFVEWDVAPANIRSYGLVRFQDLNGDGWPDLFCIANFAQHHEVLLNDRGKLRKAWSHGWDNSVTTSKIATTWPEPPIADVDGDGKLEMVLSMYHSESAPQWLIRIYDAVTGALKATVPDCIATQLSDVDGDGIPEILADRTTDATRTSVEAACLIKAGVSGCREIWRLEGARSAAAVRADSTALQTRVDVQTGAGVRTLGWREGRVSLMLPPSSPIPRAATFAPLPAEVGAAVLPPLVADVDGDGRNELIHFHQGKVTLYRCDKRRELTPFACYPASDQPAVADVDGDGKLELIVGTAGPAIDPSVAVYRPGRSEGPLWQASLTRPDRVGMPYSSVHTIYLVAGRFTGRTGADIYVMVGTPLVRSLVVSGTSGEIVWERGEIAGIERYFAPTTNLASVWDVDGDGCDDLVFTCPDYYCVAHGPTGRAIVGPAFPPKIFGQPSQGLYTLPAILSARKGEPMVCLADGHYFRAGMSLRAEGRWFTIPAVGEARAGAEGFLRRRDGAWRIGFGRQDGLFACLDAATGRSLWTYPLGASASDVSSCDIDGDGEQEFVFGTSHGDLIALGDGGDRPREVWRVGIDSSVGTPVIADVDGDGRSEIIAPLGDGTLRVFAPR